MGPEALQALMLPVESVFASLPLLVADERVEQHLYNGCPTSRYPAADGRYRVRSAGGSFWSCQCGERCAQGGKAVRGKELTTNANRFISVAAGAGT